LEDVNFLAPFKFYRHEPRLVTTRAPLVGAGDRLIAECRLTGSRALAHQAEPQVTTHFTGRVRLAKSAPRPATSPFTVTLSGSIIEAPEIYHIYFHGPAYRVLDHAWFDGTRVVGCMAQGLPANHEPAELPTAMAPRLIELCFQTAGLWELGVKGQLGLPQHVDRIQVLRPPEQAQGNLYAVVTPDPQQGRFDAEVVDTAGNRYLHLAGYRTAALPGGVDPERLKVLQSVMREECEVEPV